MNRSAIRAEIRNTRFDASQDASINTWIALAEAWVWGAREWRFKRSESPEPFAVTANVQQYDPYPTLRRDVLEVWDENECPLQRLESLEFFRSYQPLDASPTGRPEAYTVVNGKIYLGPTPAANATFSLRYLRKVCCLLLDGVTISGGAMKNDTDTPFWDSEYHFILVPTATIYGLAMENDSTVREARALRDELLAGMELELGLDRGTPLQYGGGAAGGIGPLRYGA